MRYMCINAAPNLVEGNIYEIEGTYESLGVKFAIGEPEVDGMALSRFFPTTLNFLEVFEEL